MLKKCFPCSRQLWVDGWARHGGRFRIYCRKVTTTTSLPSSPCPAYIPTQWKRFSTCRDKTQSTFNLSTSLPIFLSFPISIDISLSTRLQQLVLISILWFLRQSAAYRLLSLVCRGSRERFKLVCGVSENWNMGTGCEQWYNVGTKRNRTWLDVGDTNQYNLEDMEIVLPAATARNRRNKERISSA